MSKNPPNFKDAPPVAATGRDLVLSLFPGIDLLGRGFEAEGYCVVRGPDALWGGDIRGFHPTRGVFRGVIGGSPCQEFSRLFRGEPTGYSLEMFYEFCRCVDEAQPEWFLLENVPAVPDVAIAGYKVQRFNARASEYGGAQHRLRAFQFGSRDGTVIVLRRPVTSPTATEPAALASEGRRKARRGWAEFCALQGLETPLELSAMTQSGRYKAVGNGVYVPLARDAARAIRDRGVTIARVCICGCGREVPSGRTLATAACRKRMQRARDAAGVTGPGPVTSGLSLF